jgi:prenyltransferase beta subunit
MRRDADFFGEVELDLVYMARRLPDALKLEGLLTREGVDYLVETGTYTGGLLMRRDLTGAFFYVAPADLTAVRELLLRNNYKPYEQD